MIMLPFLRNISYIEFPSFVERRGGRPWCVMQQVSFDVIIRSDY